MESKIKKTESDLPEDVIKRVESLVSDLESATLNASSVLNNYVAPVRQSILKRFPTLFVLLVSFGVTATFLGLEKLITRYEVLNNSPELILFLGIIILIFTGRIYKKLG
jgi:hypothetical protein